MGSPGAERQITIVAPGTAPTDAANVAQVQAAIGQAGAYTDTMFNKAARQTWSVAAVSQALANMPQAPAPGQSMIGMGLGISHGEVGMAVGGSYYMPDDSIIMKALGQLWRPGRPQRRHGDGFRTQLKRCACCWRQPCNLCASNGFVVSPRCRCPAAWCRHGGNLNEVPVTIDADVNKDTDHLMASTI